MKATRSPRKDVTGAPGWRVNSKGRFFFHREVKATTGKYAPTIDLGPRYHGPIPRAYGHCDWIEDASGELRAHYHRERFVDEIVAWEFLGSPPKNIYGMRVLHLDGDSGNPAAANLEWVVDEEYFELEEFRASKNSMENSVVPHRRKKFGREFAYSRTRHLLFVSSPSVAGWTPTRSKKAG